MVTPFVVGSSTNGVQNSSQTSVTVSVPTGLQDNDTLFAFVHNQTTGTNDATATGFTRVGIAFAASDAAARVTGWLAHVVTSATAEPSTYTFNLAAGGRWVVILFAVRGNGIPVVVTANSTPYSGSVITNGRRAASFTVPDANSLILFGVGADLSSGFNATPTSTPSGYTTIAQVVSGPNTGSFSLAYAYYKAVGSGASGDIDLVFPATPGSSGAQAISLKAPDPTYSDVATLSGSGSLVGVATGGPVADNAVLSGSGSLGVTSKPALAAVATMIGSGTLVAQKTTPLVQWIANTPMYIAHRGGSANWPQHTMYAYDQAAAWNKNMALEVSVWKSADGVWVASHDEDPSVTGTWANPGTGTITTRNWTGDLQNIYSTVGSYPMIRLIDLLNKYGNSRIIFVDNKGSVDATGFFNLLDSYAGSARYVSKSFGPGGGFSSYATARGYKSWGYFYDSNFSSLAADATKFDLLGFEYNASNAHWVSAKSYGRPVLAFLITNSTDKATADTNSPDGYMVPGVQQVVPHDSGDVATLAGTGSLGAIGTSVSARGIATLTGSGALVATGKKSVVGIATLSGTGTLATARKISVSAIASLSGTGTLTAATGTNYSAVATLSGSGSLGAIGTPTLSSTATLSGTGSLGASGTPVSNYSATATLVGSGTLTAFGSPGLSALAALSGSGSLGATGVAVIGYTAVATLVGSGSLSTIGRSSISTVAALGGTGSLDASGSIGYAALAMLSGLGALTTYTGQAPFIIGSYDYDALPAREYHGYIPPEESDD